MLDLNSLLHFLENLAQHPELVYLTVILILTASSFGLPVPEEITLIAAGTISYFAIHPPEGRAVANILERVDPWIMAAVCFLAVFLSDYLVYWLGKKSKSHFKSIKILKSMMESALFAQTEKLVNSHGHWMAGVFRFTPGLRFPGHFCCGALGVPSHKFILVDGMAALLTVPTQILLVAFYGDAILKQFANVKIVIFGVILIVALYFLSKYFLKRLHNSAAT
jgi:membrane protein DedA with SNARE-associated domain